eukprot:TRINITY_DN29879_c0_g1_i1.p1 TRINITY_DN29879_c0_g1~~TRINITY_DN29879_c0_g1_i1.p1  ORF type:complete len:102 (+),score=4.34 TRINITY_DN29879_c0_g1_i1:131-436(+)
MPRSPSVLRCRASQWNSSCQGGGANDAYERSQICRRFRPETVSRTSCAGAESVKVRPAVAATDKLGVTGTVNHGASTAWPCAFDHGASFAADPAAARSCMR